MIGVSDQPSVVREPFFWFDVWQCPRCGDVVTDRTYRKIILDILCTCRKTLLSGYRHVPAKMHKPDGHE